MRASAFSERGFPHVTVEDITEAADVGKGTFFNYFESKDYVLSVMAEIQLGKVREALELGESGKQPIRAVFRHLMGRVAEEPGRSPRTGPDTHHFFFGEPGGARRS